MKKRALSLLVSAVLLLVSFTYVFAAEPQNATLKMIDLSSWNTIVSWSRIANAVDGVILRIGYRGSTYHTSLVEDTRFYTLYQNAKANGLPVGCYFYSYAYSVADAVEEAEWVMQKLESYDCKMDLPIYFDFEAIEQQNRLNNRQRTDIALAFCNTLREHGYYVGVYASKYWFSSLLYADELEAAKYTVWVAQYAASCTYTGKYDMWQYSGKGSVDGISGNVDVNVCYKDFAKYIRENGYNRFSDTPVEPEPPAENSQDASARGTYQINVTALNVRMGAGTEYPSIGTISKDAQVFVTEEKNNWGRIAFGTASGWIYLNPSYVGKLSDTISQKKGIGYYTVNTDVLNIRAGAGTTYDRLGQLVLQNTVFIQAVTDSGWGSFAFGNGQTGWISLEYADFIGTVQFMSDAGTGSMEPQKIKTGTSEKLSACTLTIANGSFKGWSTTVGGSVKYADQVTVRMGDSNLVLYPVIEAEKTFDFKGKATVDTAARIVTVPSAKLTKTQFKNTYLTLLDGTTVTLTTAMGDRVGTGTVLTFKNGGTTTTYTVAVLGDSNGDGGCDGLDLADALAVTQGTKAQSTLTAAQKKALDITGDGTINASDINSIKNAAFGLADLPQ